MFFNKNLSKLAAKLKSSEMFWLLKPSYWLLHYLEYL